MVEYDAIESIFVIIKSFCALAYAEQTICCRIYPLYIEAYSFIRAFSLITKEEVIKTRLD